MSNIILSVAIILLAMCVIALESRRRQVEDTLEGRTQAHRDLLKETREWERKYYDTFTELTTRENELREAHVRLDHSEEGGVAPRSHNVPDVPTEDIMGDSDDPIWDLVLQCRREGVLGEWFLKVRPDMLNAQPHRQYAEFGTWILNDGDGQTVADVRDRLRKMPLLEVK